jgi:two-component system sensor histidine kinase KdpD
VGDRKLGVLVLETGHSLCGFSESDLPLVQAIADLIALAIDRARWESEADAIRGAREADRHRSELIATLSHELRTPLIAIKGYSTALLLEEVNWPEEKRQEFLRLIDQECDNLQVMINDILDSALIDVGHLVIERQPVRLQYIVKEVGDEMQSLTQAHRIVMDISPVLPIVDADPYRIKQVVRNLLDNAIKYSPDGGLIVIRGEMGKKDVVSSSVSQIKGWAFRLKISFRCSRATFG